MKALVERAREETPLLSPSHTPLHEETRDARRAR